MTFELSGIGASPGIAIGTAMVLESAKIEIPDYLVSTGDIPAEVERLRSALGLARDELLRVREAIPKDAPQDTRLFIDAHLLPGQIEVIKRAYRRLYRSGLSFEEAQREIADLAREQPCLVDFLTFLGQSTRGILR